MLWNEKGKYQKRDMVQKKGGGGGGGICHSITETEAPAYMYTVGGLAVPGGGALAGWTDRALAAGSNVAHASENSRACPC